MCDALAVIRSQYEKLAAATVEAWSQSSGTGKTMGAAGGSSLGVSSGSFFSAGGFVARLQQALEDYAVCDPGLDVTPRSSLHFTFLALSPDEFSSPETLPDALSTLKSIYADSVRDLTYRLDDLRLVPLPNSLLLAGIPDRDTLAARNSLAARLLESAWRPYLEARYRGYPIPPLIWHTTLARYRAERMPTALRNLYKRYQDRRIPMLELGYPGLAVINYNWSIHIPIEEPNLSHDRSNNL